MQGVWMVFGFYGACALILFVAWLTMAVPKAVRASAEEKRRAEEAEAKRWAKDWQRRERERKAAERAAETERKRQARQVVREAKEAERAGKEAAKLARARELAELKERELAAARELAALRARGVKETSEATAEAERRAAYMDEQRSGAQEPDPEEIAEPVDDGQLDIWDLLGESDARAETAANSAVSGAEADTCREPEEAGEKAEGALAEPQSVNARRLAIGARIAAERVQSAAQTFAGQRVAFTGKLQGMTREQACAAVAQRGGVGYGQRTSGLPAAATMLVIAQSAMDRGIESNKLRAADERIGQVRKLTEAQFRAMLA